MNGEMFEQQQSQLGLHATRLWSGLITATLLVGLAIIIASYTGAGDSTFFYLGGAAFAFVIIRYILRERERAKDIRDYARTADLTYIGSTLPKSFPLHKTSSRGARSISQAIVGERSGKEVVVFDCKLGYGKGAFSRTVVAVRGHRDGFGVAQFGPDLLTEHVDDWTVVYGSGRRLLLKEIDDLLAAL